MDTNSLDNRCAILISSFDGFSDIWKPFFTLFFRYWPDCPYPIYLISNFKHYENFRVTTLAIGKDGKWASNLLEALNQIPATHIVYLQDDYFFTEKVDTTEIRGLVDLAIRDTIACLRLFPQPGPDLPYAEQIGMIAQNATYRVSLQAAIWDVHVLRQLTKQGESGWDMEIHGSERAHVLSNTFLSTKKAAINYVEGATKGKWNISGLWHCLREGVPCKLSARPINYGMFYRAQCDRLRKIIRRFL